MGTPAPHYLAAIAEALTIARQLAAAGVPIFVAKPKPGGGYRLPDGWPDTPADPSTVDAWRPGDALCAVMGHAVDGVDVDAQHGGETARAQWIAAGQWPRAYGTARTPSGGTHELVAPLGVRSRDNALPGVDVKAGDAGEGHGFLFIAPTVRTSKTTGEAAPYRWEARPDLELLHEWADTDDTGAALAAHIAALRAPKAETVDHAHAAYDAMNDAQRERVQTYLRELVAHEMGEFAAMASWPEGYRPDGRGWEKRVADLANRLGRLARADWTPWGEQDALHAYAQILPLGVAQAVGGGLKWAEQAWRRGPAVMTEGLARSISLLSDDPDEHLGPLTLQQAPAPTSAAAADEVDPAERAREYRIAQRIEDLRVEDEARRRWRVLSQPPAPPFDMGTLAEVLARDPDPPARIDGVIPWDASTLIVAQRKTGKTSLALNIAHSLITGADFLGKFAVRRTDGPVAILNFEVTGAMLAAWAAKTGLPADRLYLVNLRGRRNPLHSDEDRAELAARLRGHGVESVIVDPFGRAYTGVSQNDNGEVQQWLTGLDEFVRADIGAKDLILAAHAGWGETGRARGASALEDWPDSLIYLTRAEDEDGGERRFFRATGRNVEIEEDEFSFDPETHLISLTGNGDAKKSAERSGIAALASAMCAAAYRNPGASKNALMLAVRNSDDWRGGISVNDRNAKAAIDLAIQQGRMRREGGANGSASRHYDVAPDVSAKVGGSVLDGRTTAPLHTTAPPLHAVVNQPPLHTPLRGDAGVVVVEGVETVDHCTALRTVVAGVRVHVDMATGEMHDAHECEGLS